MKRKWYIGLCALFVIGAVFWGTICFGRAADDSKDAAGEQTWIPGKDSTKERTDRYGIAEGGITPRSAVGSMCTISYGGTHSYGSWFTREFTVAAETGSYTGYCVQPMSPPPSGTYQVSKLDNQLIKALLMMAPGYPYFDSYGAILFAGDNNSYAYAHAALSYAYEGSLTGLSASMQEGVKNMVHYANAAVEGSWAPEVHDNLDRYEVYVAYNDQQDIVWLEERRQGQVRLKKHSAQTEISDGNSCYSLKGAVYGVYTEQECGNQIGELVTGESGESNLLSLAPGTYYVKEKTAPAGYMPDPEVYQAAVISGQTTVIEVQDAPQTKTVEILLKKYDGELAFEEEGNSPQGSASLQDAEFTFRFYAGVYEKQEQLADVQPMRTWVFRSDAAGVIRTEEEFFVEGDAVWRNAEGTMILPLGTLTIQETKAPEGYNLNDRMLFWPITQQGDGGESAIFAAPSFEEDVVRGDLELIKVYQNKEEKEDVLTGIPKVEFTITSKTTGKEVMKIVTDKKGKASTKREDQPRGSLVYDTYIVTETRTPEGYNPIRPFEVKIQEENVTVSDIYRQDTLITSPIQVVKTDASTGKTVPVAGAVFQLLDQNKNVITMTSRYPEYRVYDRFSTNKEGKFTFPEKLGYGTYYLKEIQAPEGYLLEDEELSFEVSEEQDWGSPLVIRFEDENAMGRICLLKYEKDTRNILTGTEYEIVAAEDIRTPDGTVRLRKGELADTLVMGEEKTCSETLFLGKYILKETKQVPGFVLDDREIQVELSYRDQRTPVVTEEVTLYNVPTSITILKYEKNSEKTRPLCGVVFRIWEKEKENQAETYTTDSEGKIEIMHLQPDRTYCIQETETLSGYIPDPEIHEIQVDQNGCVNGEGTVTMELENDYTKVRILKKDAATGKELDGAELMLEKIEEDGQKRQVERWISKGEKKFDRLEPGTYILTESKAPAGYEKAEQLEFTVDTTGQEQYIEMLDQPSAVVPRTGDGYRRTGPVLAAGTASAVILAVLAGKRKRKHCPEKERRV